jgi:FkbM family methyltransferase
VSKRAPLVQSPFTLVDIGAGGGIHPRWSRMGWPLRAVLFEPDPRAVEPLLRESEDRVICSTPLSDHKGAIEFNLCRAQPLSSVYKPNLPLLARFLEPKYLDGFEVVQSLSLSCDTLDHQLEERSITDIDFVKIDVEGYELPILRGAVEKLKRTIGLEVEVEFMEVRKEQPLFHEVHAELSRIGFELFDLEKSYLRRVGDHSYGPDKGQLVFGNALYFRSPEEVCSRYATDESKLLRAAMAYLAYGYRDVVDLIHRSAIERVLLSRDSLAALERLMRHTQRRFVLPHFRGKGRMHRLLTKSARLFGREGMNYVDDGLGNR